MINRWLIKYRISAASWISNWRRGARTVRRDQRTACKESIFVIRLQLVVSSGSPAAFKRAGTEYGSQAFDEVQTTDRAIAVELIIVVIHSPTATSACQVFAPTLIRGYSKVMLSRRLASTSQLQSVGSQINPLRQRRALRRSKPALVACGCPHPQ